MAIRSPHGSAVGRAAGRRTAVAVLGTIVLGAALLAVGSRVPAPSSVPLPLAVGLAAHDGTDRESTLERLATELEGFVDRLRDEQASDATETTDRCPTAAETERVDPIPDADFELERSDELGRLAGAIDELTTIVADRERRFAEREGELRATNERLEAIVEASPAAIVAIDTDGTVERWNPAAERIFGWSESEALGGPLPFVPDDRTDEFEAFQRRLLDGESLTGVETRRVTSDGERIDVSLSAAPMHDDEGEVVGIMAAIEDISDRKERERRLETTTARLEALFENSPDMIDVLDPDGTIVDANRRFCEALGYAEAELIGTSIWEYERLFDADEVRAVLDETATGERRRFEGRFRRRDGSTFPIEAHLIRIDLADESRFVAICRDISERKRYERDLERTTELLEQAQTLASVGGWELDLREEPSEATASDEFYRQLDLEPGTPLTAEGVIGQFHPDDRPALEAAIEDAMEDGEGYDLEARVRRAGDDHRWVRVIGKPVLEDGTTVGIRGSMQDVTETKARERDLERTTRLLEQSQRLATIGAWELDVREEPYEIRRTDEVARILGLSAADDIGLDRALEFYHPDDRDEIRAALEDAIENGESYDLELRLISETGETRWVRAIGEPITEDGAVVKLYGSLQEITERKERERDLERYETIVQAIGDPVYTLDESGTIRFVNDAIESLAGYDPETLIGTNVEEVMTAANLETARELIRELRGDERPYATFEMDLLTTEGDVIEAENHMALLPTDDGEFAGAAGVIRDITERKERERELERTAELLEQAQRIAGVGGWELDVTTDPYELTVTTELQRLFGRDEGAEPDRDVGDAVRAYHPDDRPRVLSAVEDAVERGESYDLEVRMYMADGELRWMRTIGEPIVEDGETVAVRGSVQDITERKERERELERTTDLLERVQRMARVGGWELEMGAEPRTATWTEEMYRLHDLPTDVDPDLERTIECYHPDDRPFVRERIQTAVETETGYDFEARILTDDGDVRWVRAISEPILDDDGSLEKYRGTVQDISDRKRRELALESLHETARGLLNAETESAVADLVVGTAADLLESDGASAAVYLLDDETNRFDPVASTPRFVDRSGGAPAIAVGDGDSVLWSTYVTGSQTVVDDADTGDRSPLFGGDAPGGLLVPIGDYGVFVLLASPATIDDETRRLFETLVATTEAAFDRLESEANLRERDAELAARNRRLRRQIQITEIIRGIDRSLIGADGRTEIERTVPERLVEADNVAFAWIGDLDASGSTLEARTWAGDRPEYLDALDLGLEGDAREPAVRTARSETPTVVENVVEGLQNEPWRREALDAGFQSVVAVPLTFEEYSYGVLTVYADEPDAFTDLERSVFAELGEGIANAINAAETQEALHAETLVELTLELRTDDVLSRIAAATDATVSYEGLGTHGESETVLFFESRAGSADAVRDALEDLVSVTSFRLVTESEEGCLFEATVTGDVLASRLVRHGASPRSITVDGETAVVTVDVPVTTDVREFVEMLGEQYEDVDLRSRRHVQRAMQTRGELVTSLFEELTDRQLEVLRTAYLAGFFEWPRESTGEELAEMLDVTQPTVNRHLRIGQQRLLDQLFANETVSFAGGS